MTKNDWYETGDQIKKLVQDAVDSKDFSELSSTISNVVNDAMNGLQSALKDNFGVQSEPEHSRQDYNYDEATNRTAAERIRRELRERRQIHKVSADRTKKPVKVKLKVPGEKSGALMKWFGYSMSSMFGLSFAIYLIAALSMGDSFILPGGILGLMFAFNFCIGLGGSRRCGLAKRFRRYKQIMGERTYCLVEELASAIGQSCSFVKKDLKKMIRRGFFVEGHLDRNETLLMTDRQTYQQYLMTQAEYEHRKLTGSGQASEKKTEKTEQKENRHGQTSECMELIEEGKQYIEHIHLCNDRILNEKISEKLDRLELVITRIFSEAEKDPDVVPELKKMMSYYLPTTKKLLDAYCEMDAQPIRGQNIENTKKEIEDALDTLNSAFENLLDSLFQETAWDISSDISVLHTMLAQEGLTGKGFGQK